MNPSFRLCLFLSEKEFFLPQFGNSFFRESVLHHGKEKFFLLSETIELSFFSNKEDFGREEKFP